MKRMLAVFSVLLFCFVGIVDFCEAKTIFIDWEQNTEANLAGYKVYYGTDYNAVAAKQVVPINLIGRAANCACLIVDEKIMSVVYIGVSAYNTDGQESALTMGYRLFGNSAGDFNDGMPMSSARATATSRGFIPGRAKGRAMRRGQNPQNAPFTTSVTVRSGMEPVRFMAARVRASTGPATISTALLLPGCVASSPTVRPPAAAAIELMPMMLPDHFSEAPYRSSISVGQKVTKAIHASCAPKKARPHSHRSLYLKRLRRGLSAWERARVA